LDDDPVPEDFVNRAIARGTLVLVGALALAVAGAFRRSADPQG
jgi:hypothetical protein